MKTCGTCVDHVLRTKLTQFALCSKQAYDELINKYGINDMKGFTLFDELVEINSALNRVFNLWEGNKFKSNILKYKKDYQGLHPTQKPVLLLEDLIKTYSNKGDTVLDFAMGSGSTGVACLNTGRNLIGIEMDENYFNIAKARLEQA
jgi:site-specific DNA-methyltransferase (adenine-specific)